jgi:hypothetical protein
MYLMFYLLLYSYSDLVFMLIDELFQSGNNKDNRGNRGNWNRGQQDGWPRGRNKRLRFSVHFDVDSEEFNQLLQTGLINLAGQGYFNPPPPPIRPPL